MLVERSEVFRRIDDLLAALGHQGEPSDSPIPAPVPALVVHGVAGVGKTAVLLEAAARAQALGCTVRFATTSQAESGWPYAGVDRLLRWLPDDPHVSAAGPDVDPQHLAAQLLDTVTAAARQAPVVVVIDDVQWLDEASAHCIAYVVRRLGYDPVAVLLGHRDEPGAASWSTTADGSVHPFGDLPEIRLEELSRDGAVAVARTLGASSHVAQAVVDHCGGLPLAVAQVVAALTPPQRSGAEPLPDPMPASAPERIFRERLLSLGETACVAGAAAAVCEGMAAPALPTVLAEMGATAALVDVEGSGLLTLGATGPTWEHPLARAAAMGAVPTATLRMIKARAADALEALQGNPDTVTWLRVAAADGPSEALAIELESVAERADQGHSHRAAAEAWEAAADVGTNASRHGLRLARAAGRRFAQANTQAGSALAARALAAGVEGVDRSWLLFDLAGDAEGKDPARAVELYEQAAEAGLDAGDRRQAVRALAAATQPGWHTDDYRRAERTIARLVELHDPADPYQEFLVLATQGLATYDTEQPAGRIALERALEVCRRGSFVRDNSELVRTISQIMYWIGTDSRIRVEVLSALDERRRVGDLVGTLKTLYYLACSDFYSGPAESALLLSTQAVEVARDRGLVGPLVDALTVLAAIEGMRGNRQLAVALAREAGARAASSGYDDQLAEAAWAETFVCLASGDAAAAAIAAEPLADLILSKRVGRLDGEYHTAALAFAANGEKSRAQAVRDAIAADDGESPSLDLVASLALIDAVLAGTVTAAEPLVGLADELVRAGRNLWAGRLLLGHGSILRRAGERAAARRSLHSAAEIFEQIGAPAWVERVNGELRLSGVKVRSGWSEPLTGAELRVAYAVAEGLTNREVASQLFLSPKTVEFHLGRVYQKLGLRSRTELAKSVLLGGLGTHRG